MNRCEEVVKNYLKLLNSKLKVFILDASPTPDIIAVSHSTIHLVEVKSLRGLRGTVTVPHRQLKRLVEMWRAMTENYIKCRIIIAVCDEDEEKILTVDLTGLVDYLERIVKTRESLRIVCTGEECHID